jgi:hypothetical protein
MNKQVFIKGFENLYSITSDGYVISHNYHRTGKSKTLCFCYDQDGYRLVHLCKNKKVINAKIHKLVAQHFIINAGNFPQINHKKGIKSDNRVENLEWCTSLENKKHGYRTGLYDNKGETNGQAKHTDEDIFKIRKLYAQGVSYKKLMQDFGIKAHGHFYRIIHRKNWKHL